MKNTIYVTKMQGFTRTYKPKLSNPPRLTSTPAVELKSTKQEFTKAEKLVIASLMITLDSSPEDLVTQLTEEGHNKAVIESCFSKINALLDVFFSRQVVNLLLTSVNQPVLFTPYYSSLAKPNQALWDKLTQSEYQFVTHFKSQYQKLYDELEKDSEIKDIKNNIAKNSDDCRQTADIEVAKVLVRYPDFLTELQINLDNLKKLAMDFDKFCSGGLSKTAVTDNPFRLMSASQSELPIKTRVLPLEL